MNNYWKRLIEMSAKGKVYKIDKPGSRGLDEKDRRFPLITPFCQYHVGGDELGRMKNGLQEVHYVEHNLCIPE